VGNTTQGYLSVVGATSLANASISGTLAVAGNVSMNNVSCTGLTVTGGTINTTYGLFSNKVGIGTTTPDTLLHVAGSMKVTQQVNMEGQVNMGGQVTMGGQVNIGSGTSGFAVYSNDTYIQGPLAVGSSNKNAIANFIGTSGYPTSIACRPFNSNTTSLIEFYSTGGATRGSVLGSGASNVAYQTSSDRRLKTNIEPLDPMLDKVMSLKPSKYNWKEDNANGFGFIAQDVYEVFPHMRIWTPQMSGDIDEPRDEQDNPIHYGLDYGQFTPYIVKAIQEIKTEYDAKLSTLEARIIALEGN
jgi:hypothetical protein